MGEEESRVFVVTEDAPGCQDLRQWLQSALGTGQTAGKASVRKSAPSTDFEATMATKGPDARAKQEDLASSETQLFVTPKVVAGQASSASPEKPAGTPATRPKPHVEPGPFASPDKRAGRGRPSEAGALKGAQPPGTPPPTSKEMAEPGEFTKMFLGSPGAAGARPTAQASADSRKGGLPPTAAPQAPKGKDEPGKVGGGFAPTPEKPPAGFEVVFEGRKQQPRGSAPSAVEKPLPSSPPAPGGERGAPGEFTRAFYSRDQLSATPLSPGRAAERTSLPSLAPDQPVQAEGPGEFTRLFQAQSVKEKPPAAPPGEAGRTRPPVQPVHPTAQTPPPSPSAVEAEAPGEFTRLFQAGAQPARPAGGQIPTGQPRPPAPMSSSASQQGPGEFTQLIQGYQPQKSGRTPSALEPPEPAVPPPTPTPDEAKPGEFTMLFQRPSDPTAPPPSAAGSQPVVQTPQTGSQSPEGDEFMRMFELPSGGAGAPPQGARQAPLPAAPQPAEGRAVPAVPMAPQPQPYQIPAPQFQQPGVPSPFAIPPQPVMPPMQPMAVPGPVAPQVGPPKTGKNKFLVPVIILGGLFLIALVTILFFALKH